MKNIYDFTQYSFFTEMSELAIRHNSFDLSLGLPDFDIDEELKYFLKESADLNYHYYEPLAGNPLLVENIIKFNAARSNPVFINKYEITIVPCATFALHTSLKCILNQGDEVIIIQPSYYTYAPAVVLNGGVPVYCELDNNFMINWEKLQSSISKKTKAIIVNSPHNPTGKIWSRNEWNSLYDLIKDQEIYVISEEIYDTYCYDGKEHYSCFIHPGLRKKAFCIFSFGKMFHTTGWKVSYLMAPENLSGSFRSHQQYISYGANAPAQYAVARYLETFTPDRQQKVMQQKRDLFNELIRDTPLVAECRSEGGVFQVVNFRNISKTMTDTEFSKWLTIEKKVACLPLSAFYSSQQNSDYVRFSFVKKDELIIQALEHLRKAL